MSQWIYPKHILEEYADDGAFDSVWTAEANPAAVIGTGPFTVAHYEPGDCMILGKNASYWLRDASGNRLPYLDEIVRTTVPSIEDELGYFLSGHTDIHGVLGQEFGRLEPLQAAENFIVHRRGPAFGTTFLALNMNPGQNPDTGEPFVDEDVLNWFRATRFRQAMAHAVDKDRIIDEVLHGRGFPQWSSISPAAGDFHNPNVRQVPV